MRTVEELIGDLLLRHNCVIVPGFGGFVAKQASAKIDYESGNMLPPSKSLLFNRQLVNNDGLLVNEFSLSNDVDYDASVKVIDQKIQGWNQLLNSGQRIELDRIGLIYMDTEKNLCFEQDRFFNLLLASFGLGEVQFTAEKAEKTKVPELVVLEKPEEEDIKSLIIEDEGDTPVISIKAPEKQEDNKKQTANALDKSSNKKIWRYVAAACIVPIAFYSVWIPMKTDVLESGMVSLDDFNPFHNRTEVAYEREDLNYVFTVPKNIKSLEEQLEELEGDSRVYTYSYDDDTNISIERPSAGESPTNSTNSQVQQITAIAETAETMHYIVGCFSVESNATNLVSKLKSQGFNAKVVDVYNGLHRVSAGGAISLESLANVKASAQSSGFTGWILK